MRRIFFRSGGNKRMRAQMTYNSGEVHPSEPRDHGSSQTVQQGELLRVLWMAPETCWQSAFIQDFLIQEMIVKAVYNEEMSIPKTSPITLQSTLWLAIITPHFAENTR